MGEALVKLQAVGPNRLTMFPEAFQKVSIGNSTPRQSNRALPDTRHTLRVVSVTHPVTKHLKDLDNGVLQVLKHAVHLSYSRYTSWLSFHRIHAHLERLLVHCGYH